MRGRGAAVLLAAAAAVCPASGAEEEAGAPPETVFEGSVEGRAVWRGVVRLTGDVVVPAGATLTVEAGTRVVVETADGAKAGWRKDLVEIHVHGGLLVTGTMDSPVRFEPPAGAQPAPTLAEREAWEKGRPAAERDARHTWFGVVLHPTKAGREERTVRGALFAGALAALQVPAGRARIEDCVFLSCGTGVEVGSAYADRSTYGLRGGVARPVIAGCRFAGCGTGVFAEREGAPRVERSVAAHCTVGFGADRTTGTNYPLEVPGVTVARSDLLGNGTGIHGAFLATDSIFEGNRRALALSNFHTVHATGLDLFRLRGSVFARNRVLLHGESAGEEALLLEEAGYGGEREALDAALRAPWPPLPPGLRLREDGPARGRASDGGDPGSMADAGTPPPGIPWTSERLRLRRPQAAAPEPGKGGEEGRSLARLRPAAGATLGDSWWCRADADGGGALHLRALAGGGDREVLLGWRVEASSSGPGELEIAGDLDAVEGWCNGSPLGPVRVPRRFGGEGQVLPVALKQGANHLLLRVRGRGSAPRLGVALWSPPPVRLEEQDPRGEERAVRVTAVRVEREKEGAVFLRVAVSTPLSWVFPGEVRPVDGEGNPLPTGSARPVLEDRQTIRFGPLPAPLPEGAGVLLAGFRSPEGAPLAFPAEPCVPGR